MRALAFLVCALSALASATGAARQLSDVQELIARDDVAAQDKIAFMVSFLAADDTDTATDALMQRDEEKQDELNSLVDQLAGTGTGAAIDVLIADEDVEQTQGGEPSSSENSQGEFVDPLDADKEHKQTQVDDLLDALTSGANSTTATLLAHDSSSVDPREHLPHVVLGSVLLLTVGAAVSVMVKHSEKAAAAAAAARDFDYVLYQ